MKVRFLMICSDWFDEARFGMFIHRGLHAEIKKSIIANKT